MVCGGTKRVTFFLGEQLRVTDVEMSEKISQDGKVLPRMKLQER